MMRAKRDPRRVYEMMSKARVITSWVLLVTLGGGYGIWWLTRKEDVVTMDVKDAELADVLKEMSRQTGRPILIVAETPPASPAPIDQPAPAPTSPPPATSVGTSAPAASAPELSGSTSEPSSATGERRNPFEPRKITATFKRRPLDEALEEVVGQGRRRVQKYMALASSRKSVAQLKSDLMKGETADGWNSLVFSLLNARSRITRGNYGQLLTSAGGLITYSATDKPLPDALDELSQMTRALFVADNRIQGKVTINVEYVTADTVAKVLAGQVGARAEKFYVVRGGSPPQLSGPGNPLSGRSNWLERQDKELEARIAAMSPEQKAQAETQLTEWRAQMQTWQQMSPLQMQAMMMQRAADPALQQRILDGSTRRLISTTAEQRVDRDKRRAQWRKQAQQQQQGQQGNR